MKSSLFSFNLVHCRRFHDVNFGIRDENKYLPKNVYSNKVCYRLPRHCARNIYICERYIYTVKISTTKYTDKQNWGENSKQISD